MHSRLHCVKSECITWHTHANISHYTAFINAHENRNVIESLYDVKHFDTDIPRIETLLRNSSYIFLFLSVLPCKIKRGETFTDTLSHIV